MKISVCAFVFLIAFAGAAPALADVRTACKQDLETFCKAVKPGDGRLVKCMAEHREKLSGACKLAIADRTLEKGGDKR